jgi:serine/threonine protein kinase
MTMHTTDQLNTALAGRYVIERRIGEGGMAVVYLARDLKHNRHVALKVLNPELGAILGPERFMAEIEVTANLHHPNLLPLFDSGEAGGLLYYAMPYIEGETLRARLIRERQLGVDEAVRIASAVAAALDYAHRHNVVHRDLKPENILLHEGQPLVMDFGIALAVSKAGGARITQTGLSLGTPQYMSPEQATGDHVLDARTDIYSLAAILYEMLIGDPPHTGSTVQAVIAKVITEEPRSVRATRPSVPEHVEAAVLMGLSKMPADRFATSADFAAALTGQRAIAMRRTSASVPDTKRASRRVNVPLIAGWTLAAAGIATTTWYATKAPPALTPARFLIELPDSVSLARFQVSTGRLAISRDGSQMVFVGQRGDEDKHGLYIRRATDATAERLRGSDDAQSPSFSPRGDAIVYSTGSALMRMPATGGVPITLTKASDESFLYSSWGDNNVIVYETATHGIYAVSADGGDPRLVTRPDTSRRIRQLRQPEVLPGSKYALISYLRGVATANAAPDSLRLGLLSLATGALEDLGVRGAEPHYVASGFVVFSRGSVVYAAPFSLRTRRFTGEATRIVEDVSNVNPVTADFAVAQNGWLVYQSGASAANATLWSVDLRGTGRRIKLDDKPLLNPRISPDGKRVALSVISENGIGGNSSIWIYDLDAGTLTPLSTSPGRNSSLAWSHDGSRVTWTGGSVRGATHVVSRPWNASAPESTISSFDRVSEFVEGPPHGWSVFRTTPPRDLYIAPTDSLKAIRPLLQTPSDEYSPAISPDGRWVAFGSNLSGRFEVYVRPIPGPGGEVRVSVDGGSEPRWSPAGSTLFYRGAGHMMMATYTTRPQFVVKKRDTLFADPMGGRGSAYDVFPNGRELVILKIERQSEAHMFMLVNWQQMTAKTSAGK